MAGSKLPSAPRCWEGATVVADTSTQTKHDELLDTARKLVDDMIFACSLGNNRKMCNSWRDRADAIDKRNEATHKATLEEKDN